MVPVWFKGEDKDWKLKWVDIPQYRGVELHYEF